MRLNLFTLALKSMRHKPLSTALNILLMAVGIAMITFVLSASSQLAANAMRDAEGIDLVVGAKGSPLQLILSSIYHVDSPTGNIPLNAEAQLASNRLIKNVIPLALGDGYQGFRLVGTRASYIAHYHGELDRGVMFNAPMQAVFGAEAAQRTRTKTGDTFFGSHGLATEGDIHDAVPFTVVGILKPTGTVLDRLILTPVESVWQVHEKMHGPDASAPEENEATEHERELTALLIQYASPLAAISLPRLINNQSELQAAQPALEAAKLFRLLGTGVDVLRGIAAIVLLAATLSVFVALYNAMEERRTDLAIMRILGAPPRKLFLLLLCEGMLLALFGSLLGWVLGHTGVEILGIVLGNEQNISLSGTVIVADEGWLLVIAIGIGLAAAIMPAMHAYRTDIAMTLAHER